MRYRRLCPGPSLTRISDTGRAFREEGQALPGLVFGHQKSVFIPRFPAWYGDQSGTAVLCSPSCCGCRTAGDQFADFRRYCVPPHATGAGQRVISPPVFGLILWTQFRRVVRRHSGFLPRRCRRPYLGFWFWGVRLSALVLCTCSTMCVVTSGLITPRGQHSWAINWFLEKLDGVGPVDNRPSTD